MWLSKRPITGLLFRTFAQVSGLPKKSPVYVTFDEARDYAKWEGVKLVRAAEWRAANDEGVLEQACSEWVVDTRGDWAITPTVREWHRRANTHAAGVAFRIAVRL